MFIVNNKELKMSKKAISGEVQMFGMSEDAIREQYMNSITAKFSGMEMVVAGILSDCQEIMNTGLSDAIRMQNEDRIRKQLNVAKFILFEMMDAKRGQDMVLVSSDDKEIA
jgi:hypothetical protein